MLKWDNFLTKTVPSKKYRSHKSLGAKEGKMAGVTGLEPAASCVTGRRSNQLSYTPALG